jgi:dihydroorotase
VSVRLTQRAGEPASLVVRGARLLDAAAGIDRVGDLVVREGVLGGAADGLEVIEAEGMLCVPGFVDGHAHLRVPGREDLEDIGSGSIAAAAGGYVAILSMPNTSPVVDRAAVLGSLFEQAERDAMVRVGFHAAITVGEAGEQLTEQGELADAGAAGFSDDGRPVWDAQVLRRALQYQRVTGRPLVLHEEELTLSAGGVMHEGPVSTRLGLAGIPGVSESVAVARDVALAAYEDGRMHVCHVSSAGTVEEVRRAKARGIRVTAEVTPHHLTLTDEAVEALDPARSKMNPPLRSAEDREALIDALADGTIDCVATDHAPWSQREKEVPFEEAPFGVTGLETAFAALHTHLVLPGRLPLETLVRRMGADAASAFDLPLGPTLADGAVADIALIDLRERWTVRRDGFQSKSANSAYLDQELAGVVRMTIAGGQVAWRR